MVYNFILWHTSTHCLSCRPSIQIPYSFIYISPPGISLVCGIHCYSDNPHACFPCVIVSFCILRSGSGHHRIWQSGRPRGVALWRGSAPWIYRIASVRKPADASWRPNEQLLSDRTQPQRGQTASRSTSLKPKHGFEVHRFIVSSSCPPPLNTSSWHHIQPPSPVIMSSLLIHFIIISCHSLCCPHWSYTRQTCQLKIHSATQPKWHCGSAIRKNVTSSLSEKSGESVESGVHNLGPQEVIMIRNSDYTPTVSSRQHSRHTSRHFSLWYPSINELMARICGYLRPENFQLHVFFTRSC